MEIMDWGIEMDKNIKLIYCILGSIVLALLNNSIFDHSKFGLFSAGTLVGGLIYVLSNILSIIGIILLALFSITLIIRNIDLKHK